jgi:hypothetical protein
MRQSEGEMSKRIELGAIEFSAEFKDGALVYGSPRIEILQDSMREVQSEVPDGKYKWVLVLDLEKADKIGAVLTIQDIISRGWIACLKCSVKREVGSEGNDRGMVAACSNCGDSGYWNLFIQAL